MSEHLRAATAVAHENAERSAFVESLMAGELDTAAFGRLNSQLYFVYQALEQVGDALRDDPIAGGFVDEKLRRLPALAADLRALGVAIETVEPLPATSAYVDAITATETDPVRFVAHHYTRYLGDLSGGQIVAHRMRQHYGLSDDALTFFKFAGIDKLKRYKDAYRDRLDAMDVDADDVARLTDEAVRAFGFNSGLFAALR